MYTLPRVVRAGEAIAPFVRRKRVGPYEYTQLVENRWMGGKPRQRVLPLSETLQDGGGRPRGLAEGGRGPSRVAD